MKEDDQSYRQLPHLPVGMRHAFLLLLAVYAVSFIFRIDLHVLPFVGFLAISCVLSIWQVIRLVRFFRKHPLRYFPSCWVTTTKKAWLRLAVLFVVLLSAVGWSSYMSWTHREFSRVMGLCSLALVLFCLVCPGLIGGVVEVRIIPYYKEKVGDTDTWLTGKGIARRVVLLDELANTLGLLPISAFGYNDDMKQQTVTWHSAEDGRRTISGLLTHLRENPATIPDSDRIVMELEQIDSALEKAQKAGIPFCFLIREGDGTCAREHELREGTFW